MRVAAKDLAVGAAGSVPHFVPTPHQKPLILDRGMERAVDRQRDHRLVLFRPHHDPPLLLARLNPLVAAGLTQLGGFL